MKDRNQVKKKRIFLPIIVLAAILVVGGTLGAVLLSGAFADEEEKAAKALEQTREQCQMLLDEEKYDQLSQLFSSVSEYPECQSEIKRQLKNHVVDAVTGQDAQRFPKVYRAFPETNLLFEVVHAAMLEGAEQLYEDSYGDFMIFHQKLTAVNFYLEDLDAYVLDYIRNMLEANDYTFAATYFHILAHCENCSAERDKLYEQKMASFLEEGDLEGAAIVYSQMRYLDMDEQPAGQMFRDYAYDFMEQGNYAGAKYLLQELQDCKHPLYDLDAQLMYRLAVLYVYIEEGQFANAQKWANSFAGETRQKLLEALMERSGDGKLIADLETAVLNRMEMEAAGADKLEILDQELALLRHYRNVYFVDEDMKQLLTDYLDALTNQRKTLFWDEEGREKYKAYYQWHLQEGNRLQALDALHRDYGFAEGNETLQSLLGVAEGMQRWITAWNEIHGCLSAYLWDVTPDYNGDRYYLDVYNDTDYTFSFAVSEQLYGADDTLLGVHTAEYVTLVPGASVRVIIRYPEGDGGNWRMDWEIYDIYHNGVLLG